MQRPPKVDMALMDGNVECVDDCDPENGLGLHGEDPDVMVAADANVGLDSDAEQLGLGDAAEHLDGEEDVFSEATQQQTFIDQKTNVFFCSASEASQVHPSKHSFTQQTKQG